MSSIRLIVLPLAIQFAWPLACVASIRIDLPNASPQAEFAASEIHDADRHNPADGDWLISFHRVSKDESPDLRPEGFRIAKPEGASLHTIEVNAIDNAGLLYGGLEVAEIIRTQGVNQIAEAIQNPYLSMRGTKFNIPLDVRTPSYTDVCDAAQINLPEMWNIEFWTEYIDTLARYRYNFVSLWNLHPFPSLVKVPEYPNVALNDVWRSRTDWHEDYSLEGRNFLDEEILSKVEVVKRMTMDDKIRFWQSVMAYGKSRNVDFYIVTWNTFTYGVDGQYGITNDLSNNTTTDYFRRSVRQLLLTYPDLAGIGLTTGENMPDATFQEKEDWAMATYGQGALDAVEEQPNRKIRFIHRQHMAKTSDIADTFRPLIDHPNIDFVFSFKYAKAHVYSATKQPFHREFVRQLGDLKTIWTLRNDDVYYFRWGAPDFVREFVTNIPYDVSQGYYFGSDQYVWGRDFLQRGTTSEGELEIQKHWLQWMLWGRFAYNPNLDNTRLVAILASRFSLSPETASQLLEAWQSASMIYPLTTGFHWGALDFQWYIEGCESRASFAQNDTGFHDVNRFINLAPHAESNCQSIPDFAMNPKLSDAKGRLSPLQLADLLDEHANRAISLLEQFAAFQDAELRRTIADIRIIAELGRYYADKIRGATQLAIFREAQNESARHQAVSHLVEAARHWYAYASLALAEHRNPLWTNRVGFVDWKQNYLYTLDDIRLAGGDPSSHGLPAAVEVRSESVRRPSTPRGLVGPPTPEGE